MERRQVLVDAVDQARVDRHRDVRAVERRLERASGSSAPSRRTAPSAPAPFIVVPKVRLKLPSALKNADITFSRSSRFGDARSDAEAGLIELDRSARR